MRIRLSVLLLIVLVAVSFAPDASAMQMTRDIKIISSAGARALVDACSSWATANSAPRQHSTRCSRAKQRVQRGKKETAMYGWRSGLAAIATSVCLILTLAKAAPAQVAPKVESVQMPPDVDPFQSFFRRH